MQKTKTYDIPDHHSPDRTTLNMTMPKSPYEGRERHSSLRTALDLTPTRDPEQITLDSPGVKEGFLRIKFICSIKIIKLV
jgi:hypothetical protein